MSVFANELLENTNAEMLTLLGGNMLAEQQKRSNIGVGVGFVVEVIGRIVMTQAGSAGNNAGLVGGAVIGLAGAALFIWGCVEYCKGKGQSPWFGALGFFSCIGLLILLTLTDKYKGGGPPTQTGTYGGGPGVWPPPPSQG